MWLSLPGVAGMSGYGGSGSQDELAKVGIECMLCLFMYESSDTQVGINSTLIFLVWLTGQMRQQLIGNT